MMLPSCIFFKSDGLSLNSWGDISAGIKEIVFPVLPITALTRELIGCIVVITPLVSEAMALNCVNKIVVNIINSLAILNL